MSQTQLRVRGTNANNFIKIAASILDKFQQEIDSIDPNVTWYKKTLGFYDWVQVTSNVNLLEKAFQAKSQILNMFEDLLDVQVNFQSMTVKKGHSTLFSLKRKDKSGKHVQ